MNKIYKFIDELKEEIKIIEMENQFLRDVLAKRIEEEENQSKKILEAYHEGLRDGIKREEKKWKK